jgi:hypothetical protein
MDDFVIVKTHPLLIDFVDMLQKRNAESLSFYPKVVFERESIAGRIFLGLLNGDPCGYIYVGSGTNGNVRCHQVAIEYDIRRRLYGASLVIAMEDYAQSLNASEITLRCGFDLDANEFWRSLGYKCINVVNGGVRRMRRINIWRKYLQPNMFSNISVEPESGKTSAVFWSKHKQTGIINQFARGKKLEEYRILLLNEDN